MCHSSDLFISHTPKNDTKSDCDGFNVPNVLVQMVTLFLLTMVLVPHVVFRLSLVVVGSKWTIRS